MRQPERIEEAGVVLHLEVDVAPEQRAKFLDFCRRAFPVYESVGGTKMALYEDKSNPNRFDEVGCYETLADYQRGEDAIRNDPVQSALIKEWRTLLRASPKVSIFVRKELDP